MLLEFPIPNIDSFGVNRFCKTNVGNFLQKSPSATGLVLINIVNIER